MTTKPAATIEAPAVQSPGPQADIGIDLEMVYVLYRVGGVETPQYRIVAPGATPAPVKFNTAATPFLLPAAVEMFGGAIQVWSKASIPVFWNLSTQLRINGLVIKTNGNYSQSLTQPGNPVPPAGIANCGLTPVMVNHIGAFEPKGLPIQQPVLMTITALAYADAAFTRRLTDPVTADNQIGLWLMRTA